VGSSQLELEATWNGTLCHRVRLANQISPEHQTLLSMPDRNCANLPGASRPDEHSPLTVITGQGVGSDQVNDARF